MPNGFVQYGSPVAQAGRADFQAGRAFAAITLDVVKGFAAWRFHPADCFTGWNLARETHGDFSRRQVVDNGADGKAGHQQFLQTDSTTRLQIAALVGDHADGELFVGPIRCVHAHIAFQARGTGRRSQRAKAPSLLQGHRTDVPCAL